MPRPIDRSSAGRATDHLLPCRGGASYARHSIRRVVTRQHFVDAILDEFVEAARADRTGMIRTFSDNQARSGQR
jgi:hypothetical protein